MEQTTKKTDAENKDLSGLSKDQLIELIDALTAENQQLIADQEQKDKSADYLLQLANLKNDFDMYKKRNASLQAESIFEGKVGSIKMILPVLDTFDRAKEMTGDQQTKNSIELVLKQFMSILTQMGVEELQVLNLPFSHDTANAVIKENSGQENSGLVTKVFAKGYQIKNNDKITVLRYAQVCVGE